MGVDNLSGRVLDRYELKELLGAGGMGAVYRGIQTNLKREVAVKVLPPSLSRQPGYLERFNREAEVAAGLEHPHIVPIYDYGATADGISYVAMRLLTGGSLERRLDPEHTGQFRKPSFGELTIFLHQIAGALDHAHSRGVIHRDIKPGNIMFDSHGSAYVVDFGIARLVDATTRLTMTGMVVGTPSYMAPELWMTENATSASDQYALAVMIYGMIAGRHPFEATTPFGMMEKHLNEPPPPLNAIVSGIPQSLTQVIVRALAKDPKDRYPTVSAFAEEFATAVGGGTGDMTGVFTAPLPKAPTPKPTPQGVTPLMGERTTIPTPPAAPASTPPSSPSQPRPLGGLTPPPIPMPKPIQQNPLFWLLVIVIIALIIVLIVLINPLGSFAPAATTPTLVSLVPSLTARFTETTVTEEAVALAAPTETPSDTPEPSATLRPSSTPEPSATDTARPTETAAPTASATDRPTETPAPTREPRVVIVPTASATATDQPTATDEPTETPSDQPTATDEPTETPTASATDTAEVQPLIIIETDTATPTETPTASATDTASPTATETASPTATETPTASATDTASPTATDTASPTATETPSATATATETSTHTATPTASATPTSTPTASVTPTSTPTFAPDTQQLIARGGMTVYAEPLVSAEPLVKVESDGVLLLLGKDETGMFYLVDFGGDFGWVNAMDAASVEGDSEMLPVLPVEYPSVMAGEMGLQIFEQPALGAPFIAWAVNQRLLVTGISDDERYYQVYFYGVTGWVNRTAVTLEGDPANIPVIGGEPPVLVVGQAGVTLRSAPVPGITAIINSVSNVRLDITGVTADGAYYRVEYEGQTVWTNAGVPGSVVEGSLGLVETVSVINSPTPPLPPTVGPSPTPAVTDTPDPNAPRVISQVNANVRAFDSTTAPVVGTLIAGQPAPVVGISSSGSGWYRIQLPDGRLGWVSPSVVSLSGSLQDTPRINPSTGGTPRPTLPAGQATARPPQAQTGGGQTSPAQPTASPAPGQPTDAPAPTQLPAGQVDCSSFAGTSPTGILNIGSQAFSWNLAPGADGYRVIVSNQSGGIMMIMEANSPGVVANTLTWADGNSSFNWQVQALENGQIACTTATITVPAGPTPVPTATTG
jgi:serine/threonine-protein kinase